MGFKAASFAIFSWNGHPLDLLSPTNHYINSLFLEAFWRNDMSIRET